MAKIRVGDLAKELNLKSGEVLARLREMGAAVKTNLSTVEEDLARRLRSALTGVDKKPVEPIAKTAGVRPSTVIGKALPTKQASRPPLTHHSSALQPTGTAAVKTAAAGMPPARPAPQPTPLPSKTPISPVAKPAAVSGPRPAMPSQVRTGPVPAGRPGAPPAVPGFHPTSSHSGVQPRPAAPATPRPPVSTSTARPAVPATPATPAAPRAPGTTAVVRPAGAVSPPARTIQRSPLPAGQKPAAVPMRPLSGGAAQPRLQRPGTMVPRTTPQGAKPAVGSRPAGMTSALRAVPRAEPGKQPSAVTQVPRSQSTPAPAVRPAAPALPPVPEILQEITITEGVTVKELSEKMDRKAKDIITRLIGRGILATINQPLDTKIAKEICREFGFDAKVISFEEEVTLEHTKETDKALLRARDPVVTI